MDLRNFAGQALDFLIFLATSSTFALPFWAAVIWLFLLLNRRASINYVWRSLHLIEDLVIKKEFFAKVDVPLKLLLITLACLPFFHFLPKTEDRILTSLAIFIVPFATLYVVVQAIDLVFFGWYLTKHREANVPSVLRAVVLGGIYIIFGLVFLEWALGVNVLPLLATSTVVTAVLGLALQDTLKNLFAGLTLSFEQRFRQGDWVSFRIDQNNTIIGQVVEIGWRSTNIRTLENNVAVIPNSIFTMNQVTNFSLPTPSYARTIEFPVVTGADLDKVNSLLIGRAGEIEGVLKEPPPEALLLAVKSDHVVCRLRFHIDDFAQGDTLSGKVAHQCVKELATMGAIPAVVPK